MENYIVCYESDLGMRTVFEEGLQKLGTNLFITNDINSVLNVVKTQKTEGVIVSFDDNESKASWLCDELKKITPDIPIVGIGTLKHKPRYSELFSPVTKFLPKPFHISDLREEVQKTFMFDKIKLLTNIV